MNINGETSGYITDLQIVNKHGFTTQNPSCFEICSNEATIKQQKQIIDGNTVIVYKPAIRITSQNKSALQFLDLMTVIDKYSELSGPELRAWLRKYVDNKKVDYSLVKEYLPLYPDKVYRNIYHGVNRLKDVIEDAKKAYRNRCLEPYDRILPQITELVDLIEGRRKQIDETVKAYENMKREAKEKDVREYYDRISGSLGPYAERIYEKVFDPKWTNATTSTGKYREAIQNVVASVARDMAKIIELTSPFEETLKEAYLDTLSMDAVLQKKEELETASSKAGFIGGVESGSESLTAQVIVSSEKAAADETEGTLVRIHASQARLDQILDFMKAIGVFYEII